MNALAIAWDSIWHHRFRSLLTALGVLIGVFAVVTLTSLGGSVNNYITGKFESFGANLITVSPATPGAAKGPVRMQLGSRMAGPGQERMGNFAAPQSTLTSQDVSAIAHLPSSLIASVAGMVQVPVALSHGSGAPAVASVLGVSPSYFGLQHLSFTRGGPEPNRVVLGSSLVRTLFGKSNPIGGSVRLNGQSFPVSGILKPTGTTLGGNPDQTAFVPLDLGLSLGGQNHLTAILVAARSNSTVDQASKEITAALKRRHPTNDFQVTSSQQILSTVRSTLSVLTGFLAGLAGISLLVGGIGIMNIMLVTVAERFREIGIRKSLGARDGDILLQFLTESVLLALVGGLLGTLGAALATNVIGRVVGFPAALTPSAVLLALVFSIAVGAIFGVVPAIRAARLQPAEALRTD